MTDDYDDQIAQDLDWYEVVIAVNNAICIRELQDRELEKRLRVGVQDAENGD